MCIYILYKYIYVYIGMSSIRRSFLPTSPNTWHALYGYIYMGITWLYVCTCIYMYSVTSCIEIYSEGGYGINRPPTSPVVIFKELYWYFRYWWTRGSASYLLVKFIIPLKTGWLGDIVESDWSYIFLTNKFF